MEDEKKLKRAQSVYKTLCEVLDDKDMRYKKNDDDLTINFIMCGDDLSMPIEIGIHAERELIRLISRIPANFSEDKRVEGAIATCQVNYMLVDGSFDYDYGKGSIVFRKTISYIDSLLSKDVFEYLIGVAIYTIDEYNDKFFMLSKGQMKIEDFFEKKS